MTKKEFIIILMRGCTLTYPTFNENQYVYLKDNVILNEHDMIFFTLEIANKLNDVFFEEWIIKYKNPQRCEECNSLYHVTNVSSQTETDYYLCSDCLRNFIKEKNETRS